jgi:hypothetical protein
MGSAFFGIADETLNCRRNSRRGRGLAPAVRRKPVVEAWSARSEKLLTPFPSLISRAARVSRFTSPLVSPTAKSHVSARTVRRETKSETETPSFSVSKPCA